MVRILAAPSDMKQRLASKPLKSPRTPRKRALSIIRRIDPAPNSSLVRNSSKGINLQIQRAVVTMLGPVIQALRETPSTSQWKTHLLASIKATALSSEPLKESRCWPSSKYCSSSSSNSNKRVPVSFANNKNSNRHHRHASDKIITLKPEIQMLQDLI